MRGGDGGLLSYFFLNLSTDKLETFSCTSTIFVL